jgi:Zn-dependent peptidase ImmA (M78 family)
MSSSQHPPVPTRASRAAIGGLAEQIRSQTNIHTAYDLTALVKDNNGTIEKFDYMHPDQKTGMLVRPDGSFTIRLSDIMPEVRNHFVIAKELGHLVLHYPQVKAIDPELTMCVPRDVQEEGEDLIRCFIEAKIFAMSFLMPEAEFIKSYEKGEAHHMFGVTKQLTEYRMKDIQKYNPEALAEPSESPSL